MNKPFQLSNRITILVKDPGLNAPEKEFDSGSISVIAENKKKYISFNVDFIVGRYEDIWGRIKEKKIQLRFVDSIRFMASSLDLHGRNLVGVNGMMCNRCRSQTEPSHIDENYIVYASYAKS